MTQTLPVLRRSAVQTAKSCLYRFNQIWNLGVPDQNDYALRGIAFHSAANRYIQRLVEAEVEQDEEEARKAFPEGIASALTPAHLVPEVHGIFMRWAENFTLDRQWFLAAEQHQIGERDHAFTPDLVYGRPNELEIVDFKTFWQGWTEEQVRQDFQARFYVFNAMRIWPNFPRYVFTHSYVRFGTNVRVEFKPEDFAGFADEVEAVAATIQEATERNEWPATAGVECSYCTLLCPLLDHPALAPKRFTRAEQALTVGSWVLAMEKHLKDAKKALKSHCAAHGPLSVGGLVFDNRPVQQRSYPIQKVLEVLTKRNIVGVFDQEGLTISHSALGKLMKEFPQLEEDLKPFRISGTSYRFGARKPGGEDDDDEG